MTMELHREEPSAGPWRVERIEDVINTLARRTRQGAERPLVVAIDGRSSSGKTILAGRIAAAVQATAVVHTDDIAWWHSRFGWADLALRVLELAALKRPSVCGSCQVLAGGYSMPESAPLELD